MGKQKWTERRERRKAESRKQRADAEFRSACDEFRGVRHDPVKLPEFIKRQRGSTRKVWAVIDAATLDEPLTEDERMQVAELVNRRLAACTPGAVVRRRDSLKPRPERGSSN